MSVILVQHGETEYRDAACAVLGAACGVSATDRAAELVAELVEEGCERIRVTGTHPEAEGIVMTAAGWLLYDAGEKFHDGTMELPDFILAHFDIKEAADEWVLQGQDLEAERRDQRAEGFRRL